MKANRRSSAGVTLLAVDKDKLESDGLVDDSIVMEKENARKARNLAKGDEFYFFIGALGAVFAGCMYSIVGGHRSFRVETDSLTHIMCLTVLILAFA